MMIREEYEIKGFPQAKLKNLVEYLGSIAEEQSVPAVLQDSVFNFSAPYKEDREVFQVAIKLHYAPKVLVGMLVLSMTLESRTLGEGELVPSSIIALSDLIEEYGFTLLQRDGVLKKRT